MSYKKPVVTSLYDIFPNYTPLNKLPRRGHKQQHNLFNKVVIKKYRIFLEMEYLEELYEDISLIISSNKIVTIDAILPKNNIIVEEKPLVEEKPQIFEKMPILAMCRGIDSVIQEREREKAKNEIVRIERRYTPEKITFVIPVNYPREPPYVYINDIPYMNIINCCHLERVKFYIGKYIKTYRPFLNCVSCACCIKKENWNNLTMFSDIFYEWKIVQMLKEVVKYELILDELMDYKGLEYATVLCILEYMYDIDKLI